MEKKENAIHVSKLRAILLLEADFNVINKIIFNTRLIPTLKNRNEIPYKIIGGRRNQAAIQLAINKKLLSDTANEWKMPSITISVDTSNCFDHIAHPLARAIYHRFSLPLNYIVTLFSTI